MRASFAGIALLAAGAIAVGVFSCASGSATNGGFQDLSSTTGGTTDGTGAGDTTTPISTGAHTTTNPETTTGNPTGAGGFGGGFTTGSMSSTGGFTSTSTTSSTGDCMGTTTCPSAMDLGGITADDSSNPGPLTETGDTSAWFSVTMQEDSNFPNTLSYTATLDVPSGVVFQLLAYRGPTGGSADCNAPPLAATGTPQSVAESWGDSIGSDDTSIVVFEVRYISGGTCGANSTWTLTILGNT